MRSASQKALAINPHAANPTAKTPRAPRKSIQICSGVLNRNSSSSKLRTLLNFIWLLLLFAFLAFLASWRFMLCSVQHSRDHTLQIISLRNADQDRVIARLRSLLNYLQRSVSIVCGFSDYLQEQFFRHVIRAGAGDEYAARVQQLQRAKIYFLVTARRSFSTGAVFRKGRRVEHDRIESFARASISRNSSKTFASRNSTLLRC